MAPWFFPRRSRHSEHQHHHYDDDGHHRRHRNSYPAYAYSHVPGHHPTPVAIDLRSQGILLAEPVGMIPRPTTYGHHSRVDPAVHFGHPEGHRHRRTHSTPIRPPTPYRPPHTNLKPEGQQGNIVSSQIPNTSVRPPAHQQVLNAPAGPSKTVPIPNQRPEQAIAQVAAQLPQDAQAILQANLEHFKQCISCHPQFRFSRCTKRKKALCIGVNYIGQRNSLKGCINDALSMRKFLTRIWGYRSEDIVVLTDDTHDPRLKPTKQNILDWCRWLVKSAGEDDALFFHYSGHGSQTPDTSGDELDGYDEVIYPVDFERNGFIKDDELHKMLVTPLPPGCRLTALFDSCHSGTVLDLCCSYSSHGRSKHCHATAAVQQRKASPADVISFSAAKDGQSAADTFHNGTAVGAMSHAFIAALSQNPRQSYKELLLSLRSYLVSKYNQVPQMGSSHHMDVNSRFVI